MVRMLVSAPGQTVPVMLTPGRTLKVGRGRSADVRVEDRGLHAEHLEIRVDELGNVTVEALGPASLNGVQLSGGSAVRAGDEVVAGETVVLFQRVVPAAAHARALWSWDVFVSEASEPEAELGALIIDSPLFAGAERDRFIASVPLARARWSEVGPETLGVLVKGTREELVDAAERLKCVLLERGATYRFGAAHRQDTDHPVEVALAQVLGTSAELAEEEWLFQDESMLRLVSLAERLAGGQGGVLLLGEAGVGKRTFAKLLSRPLVETRSRAEVIETGRAGAVAMGDLLLLDDQEVRSAFAHVLVIPALRERRADLEPLAELFVARARRALGRGRLGLTLSVREALRAAAFPQNVRELKLAMERAALITRGEEVRVEALPETLIRSARGATGTGGDLRASLKSAEKEALLQALGRTRWNVTEAARQLGLPRRTVVYRMSKLGLRRPRPQRSS